MSQDLGFRKQGMAAGEHHGGPAPELFVDPAGGVGGDMFLAAMSDLGLDVTPLGAIFADAGVEVRVSSEPRRVQGLAGKGLRIEWPGEQPLRHLPDIVRILERLNLSEAVRGRATAAFRRLAEVEALVHGTDVNEVHFHEVGAVDTLVDVTGAFWGLERLGVERVCCAPLPWFGGSVTCAHGVLPLPAPATLRLLQGKPVYPTRARDELITPTGALIIDQTVEFFRAGPLGVVRNIGVGYGTREVPERVQGLRLLLVDPVPEMFDALADDFGDDCGDAFRGKCD